MRVVLVRLSALGDIVHTWPLAEAIRAANPNLHLTWVVEDALAPLVDGHPAVDSVIAVASKRWRTAPFAARTRAEIAALKTRFSELAPDLVIDAQGTAKSAAATRWTRAEKRIGLRRPWRRELAAALAYTETLSGAPGHRHVIATNLELVRAVGGRPPDVPTAPDGRWLLSPDRAESTSPSRPFAALLPGAGHPDKILPAITLAEVSRHLIDRGLEAVVVWGPSEEGRANEIVELAGDGASLAPPTGLRELAELLAASKLVVGGDTGPVHLAASLGVSTLAVFLTTDPVRNGPVGDRVAVVSGAAPGRGPRGSATTGRLRDVSANEICDAVDVLLTSPV
ncbi:MAG: lipopolysaccharide heptosyltransferase I [Thermoanaerobaculales bacterium]|jgi:heptosyltransferase-1|nr:lipopolysaccharide heptosyltransferase I [Thermoanaerobaculales bacterium]